MSPTVRSRRHFEKYLLMHNFGTEQASDARLVFSMGKSGAASRLALGLWSYLSWSRRHFGKYLLVRNFGIQFEICALKRIQSEFYALK